MAMASSRIAHSFVAADSLNQFGRRQGCSASDADGRRSDEEEEKWVSHAETQAGAPRPSLSPSWLNDAGELVEPYWRSSAGLVTHSLPLSDLYEHDGARAAARRE